MIKLKIDNKTIEVPEGTSILNAARGAGADIPTMCENGELDHFTSCMICLVKDQQSHRLIPSCSVKVEEGMDILTEDDEIREGRKVALELLLSEHVGDCEAPCVTACPAHMDIPKMNRFLASGKMDEALAVVMQNIPLPSVLGRICPAPCEGACRRKSIDDSVAICLLKRAAGDKGNFTPKVKKELKGKVAVIGSGPAGLSAAYYLAIRGVDVQIYEKELNAGGLLRTELNEDLLPKNVLDAEIQRILDTGVQLLTGQPVDKAGFELMLASHDAVVLACGSLPEDWDWDIKSNNGNILADKKSFQTSNPKVFAIGNSLRASKLAIRSVGQGREAAIAIGQLLNKQKVEGEKKIFNSRFGKLAEPEFSEFLKESNSSSRFEPAIKVAGYDLQEMQSEALRCLHCDCRKIDNCKLREYSDEYDAVQKRFAYNDRHMVRKAFQHDVIVYEPEKCIKCGICVRLTRKYDEDYGFTFVGRGFDVEIAVPFNKSMTEGLKKIAEKVADACPTGALARKE